MRTSSSCISAHRCIQGQHTSGHAFSCNFGLLVLDRWIRPLYRQAAMQDRFLPLVSRVKVSLTGEPHTCHVRNCTSWQNLHIVILTTFWYRSRIFHLQPCTRMHSQCALGTLLICPMFGLVFHHIHCRLRGKAQKPNKKPCTLCS